ncbi:DUF2071 domain-containing protein [Cupriavidus sp. SK-3]|uniref:DUF2071 domain-containing protein n=1 Tax=Cupriavidus sp. SK-3 TaxID=1470558 RepID=UPI001F48864F|nr:DUF2071 domain-containing protein [Cupriavidus sp. SK-3]
MTRLPPQPQQPTRLTHNRFVHPRPGLPGRWLARLVSSPRLLAARRAVLSRLPFMVLQSEVEQVVYLNWLVDATAAARYAPPGVRLWQRDGKTLFTVLTYAHRHFGPAAAGPLRRLYPSPLQSNWRFYVDQLPGGARAGRVVLFVKNTLDSAIYALGSRFFSDALPSHLAARFVHRREDRAIRTEIVPGAGSAPALRSTVRPAATRTLPASFAGCFDSWESAVAFLCLQDSAISHVEDAGRIAHAGIDLPIDLAAVQPLEAVIGECNLPMLRELGVPPGECAQPFCFLVPAVPFRVLWERLL